MLARLSRKTWLRVTCGANPVQPPEIGSFEKLLRGLAMGIYKRDMRKKNNIGLSSDWIAVPD
jgi:hypothetical protein